MPRFALRRVAQLVPTLVGMSIVVFLLVRLLPGDVVDTVFRGESHATEESKAAVRRALGIGDEPVGGAVRGHDLHFVSDIKLFEDVNRVRHRRPIGLAAHDDADLGARLDVWPGVRLAAARRAVIHPLSPRCGPLDESPPPSP